MSPFSECSVRLQMFLNVSADNTVETYYWLLANVKRYECLYSLIYVVILVTPSFKHLRNFIDKLNRMFYELGI
jgi:hypothetical protein